MEAEKEPVVHAEEKDKNKGDKNEIGNISTSAPRGRRPPRSVSQKDANNSKARSIATSATEEPGDGGARTPSQNENPIDVRVERGTEKCPAAPPNQQSTVHSQEYDDTTRIFNDDDTTCTVTGASHRSEVETPSYVSNSALSNLHDPRERISDSIPARGNGDGADDKVLAPEAGFTTLTDQNCANPKDDHHKDSLGPEVRYGSSIIKDADTSTSTTPGVVVPDNEPVLDNKVVGPVDTASGSPSLSSIFNIDVAGAVGFHFRIDGEIVRVADTMIDGKYVLKGENRPQLLVGYSELVTLVSQWYTELDESAKLSHGYYIKNMHGALYLSVLEKLEDNSDNVDSSDVGSKSVTTLSSLSAASTLDPGAVVRTHPKGVDTTLPMPTAHQTSSVQASSSTLPLTTPSPVSTLAGADAIVSTGAVFRPETVLVAGSEGDKQQKSSPLPIETISAIPTPVNGEESEEARGNGKGSAASFEPDTYYDFGGGLSSDLAEKYKDVPIKTPSAPRPPGARRIRTTPARPRMTSGVASGTQIVRAVAPSSVEPRVSDATTKAVSTQPVSTDSGNGNKHKKRKSSPADLEETTNVAEKKRKRHKKHHHRSHTPAQDESHADGSLDNDDPHKSSSGDSKAPEVHSTKKSKKRSIDSSVSDSGVRTSGPKKDDSADHISHKKKKIKLVADSASTSHAAGEGDSEKPNKSSKKRERESSVESPRDSEKVAVGEKRKRTDGEELSKKKSKSSPTSAKDTVVASIGKKHKRRAESSVESAEESSGVLGGERKHADSQQPHKSKSKKLTSSPTSAKVAGTGKKRKRTVDSRGGSSANGNSNHAQIVEEEEEVEFDPARLIAANIREGRSPWLKKVGLDWLALNCPVEYLFDDGVWYCCQVEALNNWNIRLKYYEREWRTAGQRFNLGSDENHTRIARPHTHIKQDWNKWL